MLMVEEKEEEENEFMWTKNPIVAYRRVGLPRQLIVNRACVIVY
jgi:hypothetical protein